MARHRGADVPATPRQRRAAELLGVAIGLGLVATVAGVVGFGINVAPSVQADELPQLPKVATPAVPVAGPVQPIFDFADMTPWDPGKEPGLVVGSVPAERPRTTSRAVAAQEAAQAPEPVPPVPVPGEPPAAPPRGAEPVRDCADPLRECECDHDPVTDCEGNPRTQVGLPPVEVPDETDDDAPIDDEPAVIEEPADPTNEVVESVPEGPAGASN